MRAFLLSSVLVLAACGGSDTAADGSAPAEGVAQAAPAEALPPFAERPADAVVIDVRTPPEWVGGVVAGAERVNWLQPDFAERVAAAGVAKDAPVYLYCRSGARSGKAEAALREAGFTRVANAGAYGALVDAGAATE